MKTKLDFLPVSGAAAGLFVRGKTGRVRLVRYVLNGTSISMIHDGVNLVGEPDFSGNPAVYLRLSAKQGELRAAFSRDDSSYRELPERVRLSQLGDTLRVGLIASTNDLAPNQAVMPARFSFLRQDAGPLSNFR